jgi:hypothetical protein
MTLQEFIKFLQSRAEFMPDDTVIYFKDSKGESTKPTDSTLSSTGVTNGKRDIPKLTLFIEDATAEVKR